MNKPKRVSLKDVAHLAGVSYQTVSKVLNGQAHVTAETVARVQEAARQLAYKPHHSARNLRTQRSRMIGYSWSSTETEQPNHILHMFLTSMVSEAELAGYHLLPFPYREGQDQVTGYRELIDAGRVDGFVISSVGYDDPRAAFLAERDFPFVAFGRSSPHDNFPYVDVDGMRGLQLATEHLIARGHRRIAILAWPESSRTGNDRLTGYLEALRAAQLEVDPDLIAHGEWKYEFGYAATQRWLAAPLEQRPTGIVAVSDIMAIGALQAGQAQGLTIGRDLAVVGFDDVPLAGYLQPGLSSIRQPIREAGRKCVEVLIDAMDHPGQAAQHVLLPP
ncbi:MAG: LacI family DNA-binding transcriptional regulator, partial [Anaerolineales bacterium]|nr:LacI family DNA-binding transcriptional regulator [Anaerolineales bacterium]